MRVCKILLARRYYQHILFSWLLCVYRNKARSMPIPNYISLEEKSIFILPAAQLTQPMPSTTYVPGVQIEQVCKPGVRVRPVGEFILIYVLQKVQFQLQRSLTLVFAYNMIVLFLIISSLFFGVHHLSLYCFQSLHSD